MEIHLTEGWTSAVDVQCLADGVPVDLTGTTVALILTGRDGVLVTLGGSVSILDAANGVVRYLPAGTDLLAAKSPYRVRVKVTDVQAKIVYFPSGAGDTLRIYRP